MHIAVVGSRGITAEDVVFAKLDGIVPAGRHRIVSGGAAGIDSIAAAWAIARGHELEVIRPDWQRYGRSAAFKRNGLIVSAADLVIAIIDGRLTPGTADSVRKARQLGRRVLVIDLAAQQLEL